jgi:iron(III) transport system ATP-binding protein
MSGLKIENLAHAYDGNMVFDGLSLEVAVGEVVSLLGPSGCGKSTVLRLVSGLEAVQQGSIYIADLLVGDADTHIPPEGRNIGLVLQDFALFPHLTVGANVAFGLRQQGRADAQAIADRMLSLVGLLVEKDKYPHMLSGGEQQRIALARALSVEPGLMLMDEPFSSLDTQHRNMVRDQTLSILKELNVPTLLVTHDPEEAMRLSDRIALMRKGGLIQVGTPLEIYDRPLDADVVRLFGEPNILAGVVENGVVKTPLGDIPTTANNGPAQVCVRPEAFAVGTDGFVADIERNRLLGSDWLIDFTVGGGDQSFQARLPSTHGIAPEGTVNLVLDPRKAYVFAGV